MNEENNQADNELEAENVIGTEDSESTDYEGSDLEDLSIEDLKKAHKDALRKLGKVSKQAGKYRIERNSLQQEKEDAAKQKELEEKTEIENLKTQLSERDQALQVKDQEIAKVKLDAKLTSSLSGKVVDVNLAMLAIKDLSEDDREQLVEDGKVDFDELFTKFPALKPSKRTPDPSSGGSGSVRTPKPESEMSDEEFYKSRTKK